MWYDLSLKEDNVGMSRPAQIQYSFITQEIMEVCPENVIKDSQRFYQTV